MLTEPLPGAIHPFPVSAALPAPIVLLDRFDFFFTQPEVVADLVNQRLPDGHHQVGLIVGLLLERALKEQNPVGEGVAVVPASFGERDALIQTEEGIGRLDLHLLQQVARTVRPRRQWRGSSSHAETAAGIV